MTGSQRPQTTFGCLASTAAEASAAGPRPDQCSPFQEVPVAGHQQADSCGLLTRRMATGARMPLSRRSPDDVLWLRARSGAIRRNTTPRCRQHPALGYGSPSDGAPQLRPNRRSTRSSQSKRYLHIQNRNAASTSARSTAAPPRCPRSPGSVAPSATPASEFRGLTDS